MAINQEYPLIDGIAPSWSDISIRFTPTGAPVIKSSQIRSIKRGRKVTVGYQRGATGGQIVKRTTGSVEYSLEIEFYRDGWNEFLEKIVDLAPSRGNQRAISLVHFGVQVQHTPVGSARIFEWRAKSVRMLSDEHAASEGNDADVVPCTLDALQIVDMIKGKEVVML